MNDDDEIITVRSATIRKLHTLGLSQPCDVHMQLKQFCNILLWLEEEKIRLYSLNDRKTLRNINSQKMWFEGLKKYCSDLGIKVDGEKQITSLSGAILDRLASLALQDVYMDSIEGNKMVEVSQSVHTSVAPDSMDSLVSPLNTILQHFNLPPLVGKGITDETILAGLKCVLTRIKNPEVGNLKSTDAAKLGTGLDAPTDLKKECVALRALHSNDLRILQNHINEVIVLMQNVTADPKTDARLGRVGKI